MRASQHQRHITKAGTPGIVVYPNRRHLMVWIALSGIPTLLHGLGTLGMLLLMIAVPGVRGQSGAVIVLIVLLGSFFVLGTWLTRMLVHVTFSGEPILVINQTGIRVGKVYGSSDIFLPWEDVESVSMSLRPPYKLFCVQPVDNRRFFSRLSSLTRLTCRLSVLGGPPIAVYQSFLGQPIEEILQQIHERYAHELELHRPIAQAQKTAQ
jgi:hypothetical protein